MTRANHTAIPKVTLDGLAQKWESSETIRRQLATDRRLLLWKNPELVGVVSFKAAVANASVLEPFFETWTSRSTSCRSPSVKSLLKEVFCQQE